MDYNYIDLVKMCLIKPLTQPPCLLPLTLPTKLMPFEQDYALTFTHEIGHTWGSHHDSRANGCELGLHPYVMNPTKTPARYINTIQFSPCSVRTITKILQVAEGLYLISTNCFSRSQTHTLTF